MSGRACKEIICGLEVAGQLEIFRAINDHRNSIGKPIKDDEVDPDAIVALEMAEKKMKAQNETLAAGIYYDKK